MAIRDEGSDATPQNQPSDNTLLVLARDHLALLVSVIGALIFAFRCVVVSAGDPYVASILVAETSVGDAIRALFYTVIPTLLFLLAWLTGFATARRIASGKWFKLSTMWMGIAIIAASFGSSYLNGSFGMIGPVVLILFALGTVLFSFPVAWELERRQRWKVQQNLSTRLRGWGSQALIALSIVAFGIMALVVLGPALVGKTFWLPRERLVFENERPFTGYVLKTSEDHLIILNDKPRVIIEKNNATLEDRDICYPEDHKAQSSNIAEDSPVCP